MTQEINPIPSMQPLTNWLKERVEYEKREQMLIEEMENMCRLPKGMRDD